MCSEQVFAAWAFQMPDCFITKHYTAIIKLFSWYLLNYWNFHAKNHMVRKSRKLPQSMRHSYYFPDCYSRGTKIKLPKNGNVNKVTGWAMKKLCNSTVSLWNWFSLQSEAVYATEVHVDRLSSVWCVGVTHFFTLFFFIFWLPRALRHDANRSAIQLCG